MCSLGWGGGGEAWVWRRRLLVEEEELVGECMTLLSDVSVQDSIIDVWQWRPNVGDVYTVHGMYRILMR